MHSSPSCSSSASSWASGAGVAALVALRRPRAHVALDDLKGVAQARDLEIRELRQGLQREDNIIGALRSTGGIGGSALEARAGFIGDCRARIGCSETALLVAAARVETEDARRAKIDFLERFGRCCRRPKTTRSSLRRLR
jgi:hypothetical protein